MPELKDMTDEIDNERSLESKLLWLDGVEEYLDLDEKPEEVTVYFGIFYLDRLCENTTEAILKVKEKLLELIEPWNELFLWGDYRGIEVKLNRDQDGVPYIFGTLCVDDNQEEESLIVSLLLTLSSQFGPEVFIKICESEGEFLLMECHDVLPEEYDYPRGNNRLWLHEGKFKFIPSDIAPNRGITSKEALKFLRNFYFRLTELPTVSKRLSTKVTDGFPQKQLASLRSLTLVLKNEWVYNTLRNKPRLMGPAVKGLYRSDIDYENKDVYKTEVHQPLDVLLTIPQCKALAYHLQFIGVDLNSEKLPSIIGGIISESLIALKRSEIVPHEIFTTFSQDQNSLQEKLMKQSLLSKEISYQKADINALVSMNDPTSTEEDAINKMHRLFANVTTDLKEAEKSVHGEAEEDFEGVNISPDEEALKYFRTENVDIDEDDFFEFFLTNALKVQKDELNEYRNSTGSSLGLISEENKDEGGIKQQEDEEMLKELDSFFASNEATDECDTKELERLIKTMNLDAASINHLQSFLNEIQSE